MASAAPKLQHKNVAVGEILIVDDENGIVEAFVAGIGNKDSGGDIIMPGAFDAHLKNRKPKGVWSHDWNTPVSKTLEIREVRSGSPELPAKMQAAGIGGLYVKTQFNLNTPAGRDAYENVKFFEDESEWSIGYQVHDQEWDRKLKANLLKEIELYEYSPVLFGMNPLTSTVSIKSLDGGLEIMTTGLSDEQEQFVKAAVEEVLTKAARPEEVEEKGAVRSHSTDTSEGTWDGPANRRRAKSGESLSYYRRIFAWQDPDMDPETKEAWRFTHHEVSADGEPGPANITACRTGIGVLNGGRGGTTIPDADRQGVYNHLARHIRDAGLEPPELKTFVGENATDTKDEEMADATKGIAGSMEERRDQIAAALQEELSGSSDSYVFTYVYATFDSSVIFFMEDVNGSGYFQADYSIDDSGNVSFSDPVAVDIVETVVAKRLLGDALKKGAADIDGIRDIVASIEADSRKVHRVVPFNDIFMVVDDDSGEVKKFFVSEDLANLYAAKEDADDLAEEAEAAYEQAEDAGESGTPEEEKSGEVDTTEVEVEHKSDDTEDDSIEIDEKAEESEVATVEDDLEEKSDEPDDNVEDVEEKSDEGEDVEEESNEDEDVEEKADEDLEDDIEDYIDEKVDAAEFLKTILELDEIDAELD